MGKKIRKAIFPAAGLGTRLLPATKVMPKEMITIFNKPMIQWCLEEAMDAGIEEFIFVVSRGKYTIMDQFDVNFELEYRLYESGKEDFISVIHENMPKIGQAFFTRQQHPLGLGHAILCAKSFIGADEQFAVILPDEFLHASPSCLKQMVEKCHNDPNIDILLALQDVKPEDTPSYGIAEFSDLPNTLSNFKQISKLVEKPKLGTAKSNKAVIGRYILHSDIFKYLESMPIEHNKELQLTDSIAAAIGNRSIWGFDYQGKRFDCGNHFGILKATLAIAKEQDPQLLKDIISDI